MNEKKEINITVGMNIKRARERVGLTQEQFSEMIGLGTKSLSAVERGIVGVSLTTLRRICKVLSISCDTLMFGEREENDVIALAKRFALLSPKQFKIANDVMGNLLEAFTMANECEI